MCRLAGPWKVDIRTVAGKTFYQVFRLRDVTEEDTDKNRDTYGGLWETEAEADGLAEVLNRSGV